MIGIFIGLKPAHEIVYGSFREQVVVTCGICSTISVMQIKPPEDCGNMEPGDLRFHGNLEEFKITKLVSISPVCEQQMQPKIAGTHQTGWFLGAL